MVAKVAYEESRQKRLEENKKRMAELNLHQLSQSLRNDFPKHSPMKRVKPQVPRLPLDLSSVRRSSRVADMPPPSYKEEPLGPLGRRPRSYNRKKLADREYASDEDREYATHRAEELQKGLDPARGPSFVKPMLHSHVTQGFWLGLPVQFCNENLPQHDQDLTLLDAYGNRSSTKYLGPKRGLSAGWRGFAIDHELVDGDALVFQLTKPTEFTVYIIRVNHVEDSDEDGMKVTHVKEDSDKALLLQKKKKDSGKTPNGTNLGKSTKRVRASKK